MTSDQIIAQLPYGDSFLFVDAIDKVDEAGCIGRYRFKEDEPFYEAHFKNNPVTPGVIITECMAQIGLVCLGIFIMNKELNGVQIAFTSSDVEFVKPVFPGEELRVESEKLYYRFGKLKCKVRAYNEKDEVVAMGEMAGIIKETK